MSENEEDQSNEITEREYKEFFQPPLEGGDLDWFKEDEFEPKPEPASKYGFSSYQGLRILRGLPGEGKILASKLKDLLTATLPAILVQSAMSPIMVTFDEAEKLLTPPKPGRVEVWSQAAGWQRFSPNNDRQYRRYQMERKLV